MYKSFDQCRGFNPNEGMIYGSYIPGYAIFSMYPKKLFKGFASNSAKLGSAFIHKDFDYIIKHGTLLSFDISKPTWSLVSDSVDFSKIFYHVQNNSISTPVGIKYTGTINQDINNKRLLFYDDIVSPRNIQVGVVGIVKKRVKEPGAPAVVQIKPDASFDTWPNYVNIEDFEWDILGNVWENPELISGWDGHTEKDDPFDLSF